MRTGLSPAGQDHGDLSVPIEVATYLYRTMVLSRAIENRIRVLYQQSILRGRVISGRGQEAIPVGATFAMQDRDIIAPVHRDLGAHLVRGTTAATVFRHYLGAVDGPSRGRDGDIHFGEWDKGVFPMVSHLPDSWPVAVGMALAFKLRGEPRVALAFCGDGATSNGVWHEAMNFAAVFEVPIVFVIENNQYAYSTPTARQFKVERLADRAAAYGMPGIRIDGNNVLEVYAETRAAVENARAGGGPSLIEAMTMRMDGHAIHDSASYVPAKLLERWEQRDPIQQMRHRLETSGVGGSQLDEWDRWATQHVKDAVKLAQTSPPPDATTVTEGVYAEALPASD
ncbi:MAG: thiamine pyrophosphate-dependent dehydrogenase E1 component subunit alpha [Acidobacteria bacterium]|nr:thiamine pyrophosphate-dependent dehydrogenase E1 component subunit alpha [Acidobacteriota bacterium]